MNPVNTKLWTHVVLSTRSGRPLINPPLESRLHNFIHELLLEFLCPARVIQGMPDHIHLLFLQNPARSMADIIKKVKGRSTFWINQHKLSSQKFAWETGYGAFAVSESQVQRVFEYISNQKEHHTRESFAQEYNHLLELHGLLVSQE